MVTAFAILAMFLLLLHNGDLLPPRQGLRRVRGQLGGGAGHRAQDLVLLHSPARRELLSHGRDDSGDYPDTDDIWGGG